MSQHYTSDIICPASPVRETMKCRMCTRKITMEVAKRMVDIEQALLRKLGSVGVSCNLLAPADADGVPVMRICIEGLEELPVFVTGSASQVLCICYLWTEDEIKPERRAE